MVIPDRYVTATAQCPRITLTHAVPVYVFA